MYSLNKSILSFAVANDFVVNMNKVCYKLGQQLQPFTFFSNEIQKKYGVLDFTEFADFLNPNISLLDMIYSMRKDEYAKFNIYATYDFLQKKTLFYDYLLSASMCYIEIPKYVTKEGNAVHTYDKFLATKNPAIMNSRI